MEDRMEKKRKSHEHEKSTGITSQRPELEFDQIARMARMRKGAKWLHRHVERLAIKHNRMIQGPRL